MIQRRVRKIFREIADEYNIPIEDVEKAVCSQYEFVKQVMSEGVPDDEESFKNVQLPHFGKFAVKPRRLNYIKKKNDGKND